MHTLQNPPIFFSSYSFERGQETYFNVEFREDWQGNKQGDIMPRLMLGAKTPRWIQRVLDREDRAARQ